MLSSRQETSPAAVKCKDWSYYRIKSLGSCAVDLWLVVEGPAQVQDGQIWSQLPAPQLRQPWISVQVTAELASLLQKEG